MKKFIVDTGEKKYIVKAKDAKRAVELVKKIDDKIKKPYSVVKIENRLGNVSVYGGPMSAEKAEQTAKYLRNRPEYRTCKIWVEKHGIEDSGYCAPLNDEASQLQTEKNLEDSTKDALYIVQVGSQFIRKSTGQYWYTDRDKATRFSRKEAEMFVAEYEPSGKIIRDAKISYEDAQKFINDAGLSVLHYKSPISDRQSILILKDRREIYTFLTAAEAIAFANKILSIAAKLPK